MGDRDFHEMGVVRARGEEGFTLLEVTFAGFVLAVAVMGMVSLITVGHAVSRDTAEMRAAKNAALDKLEEIKEFAQGDFYAVQKSFDGDAGSFDVAGLQAPRDAGDPPNGTVQIAETTEGDPNLLDIEVRVSWWGVGGARDVLYRTRLSPF